MMHLYVPSGRLPLPSVGVVRKSTSVGVALEKTAMGFVQSALVDAITAYTFSFNELASNAIALDDSNITLASINRESLMIYSFKECLCVSYPNLLW
jgi:hypothetical protein